METQAQTGSAVNMRRKPKARPPRTNVLTMNAIRNTRLACLSSGFMFALTKKLSDADGPQRSNLQATRSALIRSSVVVRPRISHIVAFSSKNDKPGTPCRKRSTTDSRA